MRINKELRMRRRVVKEFDKTIYAIDIMLYAIMGIIGYMLLQFSGMPNLDVEQYIIGIFFIFGFISLLAYFLNRSKMKVQPKLRVAGCVLGIKFLQQYLATKNISFFS